MKRLSYSIVILAFGITPNLTALAQPREPRKVFSDSVTPFPVQDGAPPGFTRNAALPNKTTRLELLFSLELPAEKRTELETLVARGGRIPAETLQIEYSAPQASADKLIKWLKANGYTISRTSPDRTSVYA